MSQEIVDAARSRFYEAVLKSRPCVINSEGKLESWLDGCQVVLALDEVDPEHWQGGLGFDAAGILTVAGFVEGWFKEEANLLKFLPKIEGSWCNISASPVEGKKGAVYISTGSILHLDAESLESITNETVAAMFELVYDETHKIAGELNSKFKNLGKLSSGDGK